MFCCGCLAKNIGDVELAVHNFGRRRLVTAHECANIASVSSLAALEASLKLLRSTLETKLVDTGRTVPACARLHKPAPACTCLLRSR